MSIVHDIVNPAHGRHWDDFLARLRAAGVERFEASGASGDAVKIEFRSATASPRPSAAVAVEPTTPEQPGKKTTPPMDIHDVLASGVIPGAPVVDPILADLGE